MVTRADADPIRALALLYCPDPQRPALSALLGIEAEIGAGIAHDVAHEVAHARLAWWQAECARLAAGQPQHPLTRALHSSVGPAAHGALSAVQGFPALAVWDLAQATFNTRAELAAYAARWSRALIAPLAALALPAVPAEPLFAVGTALCELELLSATAADAQRGRLRVPLDELARAGVTPQSLAVSPWAAPLAHLMQRLQREARHRLTETLAALEPAAQPALRWLLVWAQLAAVRSARSAQAAPAARTAAAGALAGFRAWRAARSADRARFRLHCP